jgi:hypothetical protein
MEEKYKKALMAGIICGIILVILTLAYITVEQFVFGSQLQDMALKYSDPNYIPPSDFSDILNTAIIGAGVSFFVLFALGALTFVGAGVLAARMASPYIKSRNDALIIGVVAGAAAEVVHRPFSMVFTFIADILRPSIYYTGDTSTVLDAAIGLGGQAVCCFPIVFLLGIVLAAVGALVYAMLKLRS